MPAASGRTCRARDGGAAWRWPGLLAFVLLCFATATPAATKNDIAVVDRAEWIRADGVPTTVRLPHLVNGPDDEVVKSTYRLEATLGPTPRGISLYFPSLGAHALVRVNDQLLFDETDTADQRQPFGIFRIRLFHVPENLLRPGVNTIELVAAADGGTYLSPLWIGDDATLRRLRDRRVLGSFVGPGLVATAISCLGACALVLWLRRRTETLYFYFGVGALCWGLHTGWWISPFRGLGHRDFWIWWTWFYSFFVFMLVVFCVRFAGRNWPRFERTLWAICACGPALMYVAWAREAFHAFATAWRLGINVAVFIGVAVVALHAWRRRTVESLLLLAAGAISSAFALRDWWISYQQPGQYQIFWTPYAGLLFIALVGWILIDRFVVSVGEVERMNADLEWRVAQKSAALTAALSAMEGAKVDAEQANRAKSMFLAAASHDLRQPIHALGLFLAALRAERLTGEQDALADRMERSVGALDSMFNALLDISRMDAGTIEPVTSIFALEPYLRRIVDEFSGPAAARGLRLSLRVSTRVTPLFARTDALLTERILRNLIGNAIKYTETGGVLVACRRRGNRAVIDVFDTGCGIADGERDLVFDEFYQVGNPERRRTAGLGLGLSIVRRLCVLLDQSLQLASRPGRGSRFSIDMALTVERPRAVGGRASWGSLRGLTVALIDDDPEVRDGMRALLDRWECTTFEGADADEVIAEVERGGCRPRAIVADYRLRGRHSGLDGIAMLRRLFGQDIPALIVTGDSDPERLAAIRQSGLDWMSKPVPVARLRSWLQASLAQST